MPVAPTLDPDLAAIPQSSTLVQAGTVYVMGCTFANASGAARTVTITDAAGVALLPAIDVPSSGMSTEKEWPFVRLTGVKWLASGAGVTGKVWGYTSWPF